MESKNVQLESSNASLQSQITEYSSIIDQVETSIAIMEQETKKELENVST